MGEDMADERNIEHYDQGDQEEEDEDIVIIGKKYLSFFKRDPTFVI